MTTGRRSTDGVITVDTVRARFKSSTRDETTLFTYVRGRVAFLADRKLWGILSGDLWELQVVSENPTRSVYFVKPLTLVTAAQDQDVLNNLDYEAVRDSRLALSLMRTWKDRFSNDLHFKSDTSICLHYMNQFASYLRNKNLPSKLRLRISKTILQAASQLEQTYDPILLDVRWQSLATIANCTLSVPERIVIIRRLIKLLDSGFSQHANLPSDIKVRLSSALQNALQVPERSLGALEIPLQAFSLKSDQD